MSARQQHLTDPVAALREMARVCRPGGLLAVRDVDYAAVTWFPADEGLDRWLHLYERVARRNEAEPFAGRQLLADAWLTWAAADDGWLGMLHGELLIRV